MNPEFPQSPNQERGNLMALARKRNDEIPFLLDNDQVLQTRRGNRTLLLRAASYYFLRRYLENGSELTGKSNIDDAIRLNESGHPLFIISNHLSDADSAIRRFLLEKEGYRSFADKMIYLAGLKMVERHIIRQVSSAESFALVPTPTDIEAIRKALDNNQFSPKDKEILRQLRRNYAKLLSRAESEINHCFSKGYHLALYPETTRSRAGEAHKAIDTTSIWYKRKPDGYILPISIEGGQIIQPPGTILPIKSAHAVVRVNRPIPINEVLAKSELFPKNERGQFIADYAFSYVVELLNPKLIEPTLQAYFANLRQT